MGYETLFRISNIIDTNARLKESAKYFNDVTLNGLHYINYNAKTQDISISLPNHSTHHEATSYLIIEKKAETSINTVKRYSQDLKKFLDFLLIWDIDLNDGDLLVIVVAFIDYLRCIEHTSPPLNKSIMWSTLKVVPLNMQAKFNNVVSIGVSSDGFREQQTLEDNNIESISQTVSTVVTYLKFLQERSSKYKDLSLNHLPVKVKEVNTILSGTLGDSQVTTIDISAILAKAGLKSSKKSKLKIKPITKGVFTLEQCDLFIDSIPNSNYQNKLLFYILKNFGLRRGEAATLQIDTSTLPSNLIFMEYFEAQEYIKNNLKGDIEYSHSLNKWICSVVERENTDYRSQHKTGNREIPLLFNQDLFTEALVNALKHRQILIRYCDIKHPFLFVSQKQCDKGLPISGSAIYSKFCTIKENIYKEKGIDLSEYSPHSFRHFFATYLIRVKNKKIDDVSEWLGHSTPETTRKTYLHYISDEAENTNTVEDMMDTFKKTSKTAKKEIQQISKDYLNNYTDLEEF